MPYKNDVFCPDEPITHEFKEPSADWANWPGECFECGYDISLHPGEKNHNLPSK